MHAEAYKALLKAFVAVLNVHVRTKTLDAAFHGKTEEAYEALFDAAHEIGEKFEDSGCPVLNDDNLDSMKELAYNTVKSAMDTVMKCISSNKDPGVDNALRTHYDKLQFQLGTLKGFCPCQKEKTVVEAEVKVEKK